MPGAGRYEILQRANAAKVRSGNRLVVIAGKMVVRPTDSVDIERCQRSRAFEDLPSETNGGIGSPGVSVAEVSLPPAGPFSAIGSPLGRVRGIGDPGQGVGIVLQCLKALLLLGRGELIKQHVEPNAPNADRPCLFHVTLVLRRVIVIGVLGPIARRE